MQKISFNIKLFTLYFLCLSACALQQSAAQPLIVVSSPGVYKESIKRDSLQRMVSLNDWITSAEVDLRYATAKNFTQKRLYPKGNKTFVRIAVANALLAAAKELSQMGYHLKIWDAYRPYSVTKKMWELIGDERYVANPAKGSGHNRGLAVDLTLMKDGKEVDMGTGFDHFSDTANHAFKSLPNDVLRNRELLKTTMEKHGFRALDTEWWHYSWPNDRQYEVLDLTFRQLRKVAQ